MSENCRSCSASEQSTPRRRSSSSRAPAPPAAVAPDVFSPRLGFPAYMANTRSFVAKMRPQSATGQAALSPAKEGPGMRSCSPEMEAVGVRNAVAKKLAQRFEESTKW
ncbi:hypothetical protein AXF42_Ash009448 [Apostasia shenzhenica]|uniref:DUF4005 domain-containing protein n=1 Tax=Apostasia shenzhenica TaxID=1088818 RepID=A0A2I0B8U5_9ASPA|nr:hypothetical protein AXF42_Ash009448 [Apostasia shenzhenica]